MKKHSNKNTFLTSNGVRFTRRQIEVKIREAKRNVIDEQLSIHGYNFCAGCASNDCKPLDVSHVVSVKECLEGGRAELAWDTDNMQVFGRNCHRVFDGLSLKFKRY